MAQKDDLGKQIQTIKDTSEDFTKFLREQRELNKKYSQISNILTYLIVFVFVIFIFSLYSTVKHNLAAEKLMESAKKYAPDIIQPVAETLVGVAAEVYPVYYEQSVQMTVDTLPELALKIEEELEILGEESKTIALEQLQTALTSAIQHQSGPLRKAFPGLTEEDTETLTAELKKQLTDDLSEVTHYIVDGSILQLLDLKETIDKFQVKELPDDEDELSRYVIHYLLQVIDMEVMEGGTADVK